jgi:uncharacterized protein YegP (UPF0339 family)
MIKYEIYYAQDKNWHWRLRAANGEIVCWSEGYVSKENARNSINWVKAYAASAPIYEI